MQQMWEALPSWERLGSEVLMGGYVAQEWIRAQALDKLVPQRLPVGHLQKAGACKL